MKVFPEACWSKGTHDSDTLVRGGIREAAGSSQSREDHQNLVSA